MKFKILLFCLFLFVFSCEALANSCDDVWNGPNVNVQALNDCRILAEKGNVDAQIEYGLWLIILPDEYSNIFDGIKWLRKSAQNGNKIAQIGLARLISSEDFDKSLVNYAEAYAWYAVLNDNASMKRVSTKMNKQEFEYSKKLAQEYVEKYK